MFFHSETQSERKKIMKLNWMFLSKILLFVCYECLYCFCICPWEKKLMLSKSIYFHQAASQLADSFFQLCGAFFVLVSFESSLVLPMVSVEQTSPKTFEAHCGAVTPNTVPLWGWLQSAVYYWTKSTVTHIPSLCHVFESVT